MGRRGIVFLRDPTSCACVLSTAPSSFISSDSAEPQRIGLPPVTAMTAPDT